MPIPTEPGFYWATDVVCGTRLIVSVEPERTSKNAPLVVYSTGWEAGEDFSYLTDWSERLEDPQQPVLREPWELICNNGFVLCSSDTGRIENGEIVVRGAAGQVKTTLPLPAAPPPTPRA